MTDKTVTQALAAVMEDVRAVGKNERNTHQNFNFRGVDAVVNAVGPIFRRHGVVVMPTAVTESHEQVEVGSKRSLMESVHLTVTYTFYGPAGDSVSCEVAGAAMDAGDKATAKAMSVALRTALLQALTLPTDEPDPDSETFERSDAAEPDVHPATAIRQTVKGAGLVEPFTGYLADRYSVNRLDELDDGQLSELLRFVSHADGLAKIEEYR